MRRWRGWNESNGGETGAPILKGPVVGSCVWRTARIASVHVSAAVLSELVGQGVARAEGNGADRDGWAQVSSHERCRARSHRPKAASLLKQV